MKRGKDVRDVKGRAIGCDAAREVSVLMFVLVEHSPGAFKLRLVSNDELLEDLRKQGTLKALLDDADHLYADFRARFEKTSSSGHSD